MKKRHKFNFAQVASIMGSLTTRKEGFKKGFFTNIVPDALYCPAIGWKICAVDENPPVVIPTTTSYKKTSENDDSETTLRELTQYLEYSFSHNHGRGKLP